MMCPRIPFPHSVCCMCVLSLLSSQPFHKKKPTQKDTATIHKHTMPKRHADSTQDENAPKRRQLSANEVLVEAAKKGDTTSVRAVLEKLPQDSKTVVFDAVHETCRGNHDECLALLLPYVETTQVGFGILLSECVHANHVACTEVLLQHWKSVCKNEEFVPQVSKHHVGEADIPCPAMWSDPAVCRVFIDAGADIETKDEKGRSPLHRASDSGALDNVKMLVEAGAGVNVTDNEGAACLTFAAIFGHTETVRYLVGLPEVDVNHRDGNNYTALHYASGEGDADVVQVLIDAGADIEEKDEKGRSPLHCACVSGALDIVKMLVEAGVVRAGAGVFVTDSNGDTCLSLAAYFGHTETVRYLVGLPEVEINNGNASNYTALHRAGQKACTDVVRVLIDAGADVDIKNSDGRCPLHCACETGALDNVKMLVRAGAGVNVTDNKGNTCLTVAAYFGHTETVRYLVGLPEVEINSGDANNYTALHRAGQKACPDMVRVLIDAGADIDIKNDSGRSPLHCAVQVLYIVKMLVEAGAGVRDTDNEGDTCLSLAAFFGHTETVRYLVGLPEVDVNHRDSDNSTALHYAVEQSHTDIAQLLIAAGADMDTENTDGRSP